MPEFKIVEVNTRHCQVTYSCRNAENQRIFYCLQDNGKNHGGIRLMRCTQEGEPQNSAWLKRPVTMEMPTGDSKLEGLCREWIKANAVPHE